MQICSKFSKYHAIAFIYLKIDIYFNLKLSWVFCPPPPLVSSAVKREKRRKKLNHHNNNSSSSSSSMYVCMYVVEIDFFFWFSSGHE